MGDEQSIQILRFIFCSQTFAHKRLAQGLKRSPSRYTSFVREYSGPIVKADRCAQDEHDIGVAAHTPNGLIQNIERIFMCFARAGLKLSMDRCQFGQSNNELLRKTIGSQGISPIEHEMDWFLKNLRPPTTVKSLQRWVGFVNFFGRNIPNLAEKLIPFYKTLKKDTKFTHWHHT